jgi:hypothetical protein
MVADAEAQHLVDGNHVPVRAGVSGQNAPDARVAARQLLQVRDLDQQAEPVPAVLLDTAVICWNAQPGVPSSVQI